MLYLRLSIGVIFILLSTKIGKNKGIKYKNSFNFYESCLTFCNAFKGDLLYKKSKLEDFLTLEYSSLDFIKMLKNYIQNQEINDYPEYLKEDERLDIYNFLSSLGKTDSVSQLEVVDAFKSKFTLKLAEKNLEYKKYYSLSVKLGFVIGVAFMIMVV